MTLRIVVKKNIRDPLLNLQLIQINEIIEKAPLFTCLSYPVDIEHFSPDHETHVHQ